jgi:hypothetical protein
MPLFDFYASLVKPLPHYASLQSCGTVRQSSNHKGFTWWIGREGTLSTRYFSCINRSSFL